LIERTVAVALIVTAEDQPVAIRRVLQHFGCDGDVVANFTGDADPSSFTGAAAALAGSRSCAQHHWRSASAGAATTGGSGERNRRLAGGNLADLCCGGCRQRLSAGCRAIALENPCREIQCGRFAKRSRAGGRHVLQNLAEQLADNFRAPLEKES